VSFQHKVFKCLTILQDYWGGLFYEILEFFYLYNIHVQTKYYSTT